MKRPEFYERVTGWKAANMPVVYRIDLEAIACSILHFYSPEDPPRHWLEVWRHTKGIAAEVTGDGRWDNVSPESKAWAIEQAKLLFPEAV